MLGLRKSEKVGKLVIEKKEYELRLVNWAKLSKASLFSFLSVSLCLWREGRSFPWVWRGPLSLEGLMTCLWGEGEGQRVLPPPAISQIPSP